MIMMNPADLYFSLEGRARRRDWWIGMTPLVIMAVLLPDTLFYLFHQAFGGLFPLFKLRVLSFLLTATILLHPVLAIFIKRLHDLPRSAWWAFFMLSPVFLAMALNAAGLSLLALLQLPLGRISFHIYFAVSFWLVMEMAFRKSLPADSKYGRKPS